MTLIRLYIIGQSSNWTYSHQILNVFMGACLFFLTRGDHGTAASTPAKLFVYGLTINT